MIAESRKILIRLALTPRQKREICEATGREINTLELRLAPLPLPDGPPDRVEPAPGSPEPHDPIIPRRKR